MNIFFRQKNNKLIKAILFTLVIAVSIAPASSFVHASELNELDRMTAEVTKYITINENGVPQYEREQAIANNVDKDVLEMADKTYEFMMAYYYEENGSKSRAVEIPIYGNYCGPHYGDGTPIDLLDTQCKKHDNCYQKNGRHKCSCDEAMLKNVKNNLSKMTGAKQKAAARGIIGWLTIKTANVTTNGGAGSCRK